MGDPASTEVPLPLSVERLIANICVDQAQPPPDTKARKLLASIGEDSSVDMLSKISRSKIKTLSGFITYLAKDYPSVTAAALSPHKQPCTSVSSTGTNDYIDHSPFSEHLIHSSASSFERASSPIATHFSPSSNLERTSTPIATHFSLSSSLQRTNTPIEAHSLFSPSSNSERLDTPIAKRLVFSPSSSSVRGSAAAISQQGLMLIELEFRKAFLVLSYMGRKKH